MTERLSSLLHEEAARLDVPHPRAAESLTQGRRIRRRRRATTGALGLVVAAAVGLGAVILPGSDARDTGIADTTVSDYEHWGAWSDGSSVYVGGHEVVIGEPIKAMYYTSEGVLVRTGESLSSDGGGPSTFTLVHPDGTKEPVPVTIGETVPATSLDQPYLAYSEPNGNAFDLVLYDLELGVESARITITESMDDLGWPSPPVSLGDGVVWALVDDGWKQWDVETGEVTPAPIDVRYLVGFSSSRYAVLEDDRWVVQRMSDGRVLGSVDVGATPDRTVASLSPDGEVVIVTTYADQTSESLVEIFGVDTGEPLMLPSGLGESSWTPGGRLLAPTYDADGRLTGMRSCDVQAGGCDTSDWEATGGITRLAGLPYES